MIIKKFLHSCIVLENEGKRLLLDPGAFSFIEKKVSSADIGNVDAILVTHKHIDHYFPEALKALQSKQSVPVIANEEVCALLEREGIQGSIIKEEESIKIASFRIKALKAPHEPIPGECPHNLAFSINETVLHPGDSFRTGDQCEVLLLPIAGPWCRLVDAINFAQRISPKKVVPIHDAVIKEFMLERMYQVCESKLEPAITFHPLRLGEQLRV